MKLLLDENIPVKLKMFFSDRYKVYTIKDQGWQGFNNGKLIKAMESEGFQGLITMDQNLIFQQNIKATSVKIFILCSKSNSIKVLAPLVQKFESMEKKDSKNAVFEIKY